MSFKNFMGGYMVIVPAVILFILRLFLPAVDSTTVNFAVVTEGPNAVAPALIEKLSQVGDISEYSDIEGIEKKLAAIGIAEGLYFDPEANQYVSVLEETSEKNETFSIASRYVRQYYLEQNYANIPRITSFNYGVPEELSDRTETSPVATMGGSIFFVFMLIVTAFLLGISIVEDKDQGTISALMISPVSKADYYFGRTVFPIIINVFYGIIAVLVLGLGNVNFGQVLVVYIFSFSTTIVFGLLIGALGNNEVEAIGIGKVTSMILILAILGTTLLPENWHWTMWWSPAYWTYAALEGIFTRTTTWIEVLYRSAGTFIVSAVYFLLLRKKIISGLS